MKDIKPATPSRPPVQMKVFQADELRQALMPTLEKLLKLEESIPFRQPVDAEKLSIPVSNKNTTGWLFSIEIQVVVL